MSDSADTILQQLGGIGSAEKDSTSPQANIPRNETAIQVSEELDRWRMLLVDLVYQLNGAFRDVHYWKGAKTDKDPSRKFIRILHKLQQMSPNDGLVRIELRGNSGTKVSEKTDYIIRFGDLMIDVAVVSAMIKRIGIRVNHFEGRIIKSFETFSAQGFNTINIKIPEASDESLEKMRICMRIISCFNKAVEDDAAIEYVKNGQSLSVMPVLNESHQPDPNLTQLSAINDLAPENMQEIIQKVAALMKSPNFANSDQPSTSVYQTIFYVKSLRQRLDRPSIELNYDRASQAVRNQKGGPGGAPVNIDPVVLKANMAKFVKDAYGDHPEKAAQVMKTIYGDDYHQLSFSGLEGRLQLITDLFVNLETNDTNPGFMQNVVERIQTRIDQLPAEMLDNLIVDGDEIKVWEKDEEKIIGKSNDNLLRIIDTAKDRSAARKKKKMVLRVDGQITDQDYEQLSKTYNISIQEAREIAELLKSCFDGQGNFQRALFEKNVSGFAAHPKRIFEILWEFLKEIPRRSDRLPFLNSLQLLVKEIKQPTQAIKILVSDFILFPGEVNFPDRNALMLAIQFLRDYNKEINVDIEITPEEVLMVNKGLVPGAARYLAWKLDGDQNRFVEKMVTIRKKLLQSFEQEGSDLKVMPIRFLLALEREAHIFLALVGGKTATTVIRGALNVYGNPASQIFLLKESPNQMVGLLQHLGVLIRGIGRIGQESDLTLLDDIQKRQQGFDNLSEEPRHAALVNRILEGIDSAKHQIGQRGA